MYKCFKSISTSSEVSVIKVRSKWSQLILTAADSTCLAGLAVILALGMIWGLITPLSRLNERFKPDIVLLLDKIYKSWSKCSCRARLEWSGNDSCTPAKYFLRSGWGKNKKKCGVCQSAARVISSLCLIGCLVVFAWRRTTTESVFVF